MQTETIKVGGMMCAACVGAVERAVKKIDGVDAVVVNLATESVRVTYDGSPEVMQKIKQSIIDEDYTVIEPDAMPEPVRETWLTEKRRLLICILLTVLMLTLTMGPMIPFLSLKLPAWIAVDTQPMRNALVQLFISSAVMLLNFGVYIRGYKQLFRLSPGMDSLIAVSTTASFLYSCYTMTNMLIQPMEHAHDLYFESTATILTLVMIGKYLENRAKRKTNRSVDKLRDLAPKSAVILQNGQQIEIPLTDVQVGDSVVVKPGGRIPVDGAVVEGESQVDESMITGESIPIVRKISDNVIGGSQNIDGMLVIRVTKTGQNTVLSQIIRLVQEAQGTKAPIARLADKAASVFVPVVMSIAVLAGLIWFFSGAGFDFSLRIFVTVLVIACPCALGLATPTAIMVGTGAAAEHGLLFKNGETLERLCKTKKIIFDKTGTITEGKPQVVLIETYANVSQDELVQMAASAEQYSEHTISQAILNEAKKRGLELLPTSDFSAASGKGISAVVNGKRVAVGNMLQMQTAEIDLRELDQLSEKISSSANTVIIVAAEHSLLGVMLLSDVIRGNSAAAIEMINQHGIETVMLTGDNQAAAQRIAAEAKIETVIAGVLPSEKAAVVQKMRDGNMVITMVGDGINDAPALAAADIGIAVASGTDIAIEAADLVLMKNDLMDVYRGIEISARTIRNIKQNLFWAFAFNTLGIPVAAGVLYPFGGPLLNPMIAAAAMSLSSFFVVSNALRIKLQG